METQTGLTQPLPTTLVFDYPTLQDMVDYLITQFDLEADTSDEMETETTEADLETLSEAELVALLAQELDDDTSD